MHGSPATLPTATWPPLPLPLPLLPLPLLPLPLPREPACPPAGRANVLDDAVAPTRMSTDLNRAGQRGILFYKDVIVSHIVDEATRFCAVSVLKDKSSQSIVKAFSRDLVLFFGAPSGFDVG